MGISFSSKGDWQDTEKWLQNNSHISLNDILNEYGQLGVEALKNATPIDTGKTAESWSYEIETPQEGISRIVWHNSNVNEGANVAILLIYGHGTKNGGYVEANDFVSPVMKTIFDSLSDSAYRKVVNA